MAGPKHPDPEGKMASYAPGYGPGPDGEPVELPPDQPMVKPGPPEPEPEPEPDEDDDSDEEEEAHAAHPTARKKKRK